MEKITRRDFIKCGLGGMATLVVGSGMSWLMQDKANAAVHVQALNFHITDALKDMVTHNAINTAQCYFWIYKDVNYPAECPGPNIFALQGDTIEIIITNDLDEPHAFYIPGMFNSGPIAPGQTVRKYFTATKSGSHLYYDNLNAPVNRVMGLYGAFIVMPKAPAPGHKFTPYENPTPTIQKLFDDLGTAAWWPGLSWEQGDVATATPPFRQYIWVTHEASPLLFQEVGNYPAGLDYPAAQFLDAFLSDPYADTFHTGIFNRKAHFFCINGQSGHFVHNNPFICPNNRVGEPSIIRVLGAGLHTHSMHIHANHVYTLSLDGQMMENLWWVDTMTNHPLGNFDWLVPYMRPPDVPNVRGIGRADTPLTTLAGGKTWPPVEELNTFIPPLGTKAGVTDISVQLSPLCYPMHSHSEASQTSQGGNYNCGLISGINFTGDRNTPGGVTDFPMMPIIHGPGWTGPSSG
jgi:FtsP/CotA-like multicopper oxidase with cupredoxin domain